MKVAVSESMIALLESIIDYAGLFPPAQLDMARTVQNYARYIAGDEQWMLGRLIVPVARLAEFEQHANGLLPSQGGDDGDEPWQISALTAAASDPNQLAADLDSIAAFNARHVSPASSLAVIDTIELKAVTADEIESALDLMPDDLFPFFELPIERDPRGLIAALADADAGAKVRTGGTMPSAYPQPSHLARFISACVTADVPFKATAGLHHPLRHFSKTVNTDEFGFLNVFMAGCLASVHQLDAARVQEILEESAIERFTFADDFAAWGNLQASVEDIGVARGDVAVSFGSCSFDEPIHDLRELKLLP